MSFPTFYMTPGSCSTGIHILLEECGLVFQASLVNLLAGDQHLPEYLALNPKGTIPTLVLTDGTALTDFLSIALWLARSHPKRQLIPADLLAELRVIEQLNLAVNQLHGQGFTRIFTTDKYSSDTSEQARIQAQGKTIVADTLALFDQWLDGRDYLGEQFSIADAALFYNEFWAVRIDLPLPENCQRHYRNLLKRPSVRQVLAEEGYNSALRE